ncbi:MAG: hypothetical protein ACK5LJ_01420 [Paracoccus sp. (in: a-proteobacteria)]
MFGFLKKALSGGETAEAAPQGDDDEIMLELSPDDLESPARLGPKLATFARMQQGVTDASYDPESELLKVSYASGLEGTSQLDNVIATLSRAESGEAVIAYLENFFADPGQKAEGYMLPVLKPAEYVETARKQLREAGQIGPDDAPPFWYGELAEGLVMILVQDTPEMMRLITMDDLEALDQDGEATMTQAQISLIEYVSDKGLGVSSQEDGLLHFVELDDNYEASTYFLEGFWNQLEQDMGGAPAAIFAARNIVVFANSADPEAMAMLNAVATAGGDVPPYAIAPDRVWLWQDEAWQPWQAPPEKPPVLH